MKQSKERMCEGVWVCIALVPSLIERVKPPVQSRKNSMITVVACARNQKSEMAPSDRNRPDLGGVDWEQIVESRVCSAKAALQHPSRPHEGRATQAANHELQRNYIPP